MSAPSVAGRPRRTSRILILGGGYIGLYTALGLRKQMGRDEVEIAIVDPRSYMTYQPFLPEAAAGSLEPRHVVAPLRRELKGCTLITGSEIGRASCRERAQISGVEGCSWMQKKRAERTNVC